MHYVLLIKVKAALSQSRVAYSLGLIEKKPAMFAQVSEDCFTIPPGKEVITA
jgi:hypothetical protein